MTRQTRLAHRFVHHIPDELEEGVLYISIEFATALHLCCCGCGQEVVTPITPTDWRLVFDGDSVTLKPSIGSWSLPCRSHYWIWRNEVEWAPSWSDREIEEGRRFDREAKRRYFATGSTAFGQSPDYRTEERDEDPWPRRSRPERD